MAKKKTTKNDHAVTNRKVGREGDIVLGAKSLIGESYEDGYPRVMKYGINRGRK